MTLSAFIQKNLFKIGLNISTLKKRNDIDIYKSIYGAAPVINKLFLNIGSGTFKHEAWLNLDFRSKRYKQNNIDINFDLSKNERLPFKDNTFYAVYSSHTIEHLYDKPVITLINEAHRILRKGGVLRITTPDSSFLKNNPYFLKYIDSSYTNYFYGGVSKENPCLHRSAYDENKLRNLFLNAGFSFCYRSEYGKSRCPVMQNTEYFDNTHPWLSIYFEGIKTA